MQKHGAVLAEALGCVPSDSAVKDAGQDSSLAGILYPDRPASAKRVIR